MNKICSRCTRKLAKHNTNPDDLCGYCQRILTPHHNGAAYKAWVADGKPRLEAPTPPRARHKRALRLPCDPAKLDIPHLLAVLGACKVEVERRSGEARKLLAALEG